MELQLFDSVYLVDDLMPSNDAIKRLSPHH